MGEDELAAIEQRSAQATRGPWRYVPPEGDNDPAYVGCDREDGAVLGDSWCEVYTGESGVVAEPLGWDHRKNAAFIAHARADIPNLVAEVRRLRSLLAEALPFLAHYQCDDQEEGDALADLERRIDAALAGTPGEEG